MADDLLKVADALALDLLAFRLAFLALDAKLVFLRDIVLLGLAIDGADDGRRQLDAGNEDVVEDDGIPHRDAVRLFAFVLHHLLGKPVLRELADLVLNFLPRRRIDLFGRVSRDHLAGETADPGLDQHVLVVRSDRLVQHRHRVALQAKADDDRCVQIHAVARDGVEGFGEGLQPQVVQKHLIPGRNEIEALVFQQPRIEHGAVAEALPQNADVAAGDGDDHVRIEHHRDQGRHHQIDHDAGEMAVGEAPPPRHRRGRCSIRWPKIRFQLPLLCLPAAKPPSLSRSLGAEIRLVNMTRGRWREGNRAGG